MVTRVYFAFRACKCLMKAIGKGVYLEIFMNTRFCFFYNAIPTDVSM